MDWSKIGSILAREGMTVLGGALGGPAGAAVGRMVGNAIGAGDPDDPEEVHKTLEANPLTNFDTLRNLEAEQRHELAILDMKAQIVSLQEVNRTMRVEAQSSDAYTSRARPTLMYGSLAIVFLELIIAGAVAVFERDSLAGLVELYKEMVVPQSILMAAVGVYVPARSRDKAVAAGHPPQPGLLGAVASRIMGPLR